MKRLSKIGFFALSLGLYAPVAAQLTVQQETPVNLVNNVLVGNGVNVSNITSQGNASQFGRFTASGTNLGIPVGAVLATCNINPPLGLSNTNWGNQTGANSPGNPLLSALVGGAATNNAAVLTFDFIPTGDTLRFDYVFASNEYNNFVNTTFNDVFGFFLTGPNPTGGTYANTNIALIPGSGGLPVTINNVNNGNAGGCAFGPCSFCQFFVDNCNNTSGVGFRGHTTVLRVVAPVVPCSTYTIRIGVADVIDGLLNSAVFLRAGSFSSGLANVSSEVDYGSTDTLLYQGCSNATIRFTRSGDISQSDTVNYTLGGTAVMGTDYNNLPGFIVFPPGVDTIALVITPFFTGVAGPNTTITIAVSDSLCGQVFSSSVTLTIINVLPLSLSTPDSIICRGQILNLPYTATGGSGNFTVGWTNNTTGNNVPAPYLVQPPMNTSYTVSVYDDCLDTTVTQVLNVLVYPRPNVNVPNFVVCSNSDLLITPNPANLNGFNYTWSPADNLNDATSPTPIFNAANTTGSPVPYTIVLAVDSGGVTCSGDSGIVLVNPLPEVGLNADTTILCEDLDVTLGGPPGFVAYFWQGGPNTQDWTVSQSGWFELEVLDNNGCRNNDSIYVQEQFRPVFTVDDVIICQGDTAFLIVPDTLGAIEWDNGETTPVIGVTTEGFVSVTISNFCGATSDSAFVTVIDGIEPFDLPNVLTPNDDGINDTYQINNLVDADSFQWDIYNRWGVSIFTSKNINDVWDGRTSSGALVAQGTYFIVLSYVDCLGNKAQTTGTVNVFY
jgi:gliding motility-associated-like protein